MATLLARLIPRYDAKEFSSVPDARDELIEALRGLVASLDHNDYCPICQSTDKHKPGCVVPIVAGNR